MNLKETILQFLAGEGNGPTGFALITKDNGYSNDCGEISRSILDNDESNSNFSLEIADTDKESFGPEIGNLQQVTMNLMIIGYIKGVTDVESAKTDFQADIKRCIHLHDPQFRGVSNLWPAAIRDSVKYFGLVIGDNQMELAEDSEAIFTIGCELIYYYEKTAP